MAGGGTVQLPPMPAKRFRDKILANLKNVDIITVRGKGYKLIGVKK
jgi:DNA-binding response OmpR family regulator